MKDITYNWNLKDVDFTKDKGTVFSCFSCGGGSSMGYKLAGFDVLGCNEIDPKMMKAYITNLKPKYSYLEPIQLFKKRKDLPKELYNLDILDGSPPCSSFSLVGNREKDWGVKKKFAEGQAIQVLDTLFFDFIDLAKELQPKVVIAENVKGILMGSARKYVKKIYKEFEKAGYYCQHFILDSSKMGVPQKRERVFFICLRKDLSDKFIYMKNFFQKIPFIDMSFNEKPINFEEIFVNYTDKPLSNKDKKIWDLRKFGDKSFEFINIREFNKKNLHFGKKLIYNQGTINTILSNDYCVLYDYPRHRNFDELCSCGTFPKDYNFEGNRVDYLIGMSVPPLMMFKIAREVYKQWLCKI